MKHAAADVLDEEMTSWGDERTRFAVAGEEP